MFDGPEAAEVHPASAAPRPPTHRFQVWFAPLAAATVVALSVAPVWLSSVGPAAEEVAVASLAAAGDPPVGLVEHNALPRPSFRSTIGGSVASSFGSLLLRQTNILAR